MAKSLASSIKILPVVKSAGGFVSKALKNGVYIRSEKSPDDISRPVSVHGAFLASQPRSRAAFCHQECAARPKVGR